MKGGGPSQEQRDNQKASLELQRRGLELQERRAKKLEAQAAEPIPVPPQITPTPEATSEEVVQAGRDEQRDASRRRKKNNTVFAGERRSGTASGGQATGGVFGAARASTATQPAA